MFLLTLLLTQAEGTAATQQLWERFLSPEGTRQLLRAALVLATGIPLVLILSRWTRSGVSRRYSLQQGMISGKVVFYAGLLIIVVSVLMELGFSLTPLLGAAGIMGIAVGFAAQTSVSNVISGFFLMAEQPFVVDDVIQVGDVTGRVLSIDMLSVKLRTFDNRFVRIPNENLIKAQFINLTRFPIRRLDLELGVAYKENVPRVREILMEIARKHPLALMEPEPQFFFTAYGDSSLDLLFGVWTRKESFFALRNTLREQIKERLDAEGIEIPFPHRTLYAGEVTDPFPIRIVGTPEPPPVENPSTP